MSLDENFQKDISANSEKELNSENRFYNPGVYNLDEEYKKYSLLLQKGEIDKKLFFKLGRINHFRGNLDEAFKYYNKALELDPDYGEVHYNLGNIYFEQGKLDKGQEHFLKAIEANSSDIYALNALGKTCFRLKKFIEAAKYHSMALEKNPEDVYALRGLGNIWLVKKNFGEALNYYHKALDVNSSDRISRYNIGLVYLFSGKAELGEKHYREAIDTYKYFSPFYFGLGLCYYRQGKEKDGFEEFKTGLTLFQKSDYISSNRVYEKSAETDFAFKDRLDDEEWNDLASDYHFCKGNAYYSINNLAKSIEELVKALDFKPGFSSAHSLLGKLYFKRGIFTLALKHYEEVLKLEDENIDIEKEVCVLRLSVSPDNLDNLKRLRYIYWLKMDFKSEIDILEKLIKISDEPEHLYNLGLTYLSDGQKDKGEECFRGLLERDRELACAGFSHLYYFKKDYVNGLKQIEECISVNKKSEYYIQAGNIYRQMGDRDRTLESYFQAFNLSPYSRLAYKLYIDCLLEEKDYDTVRRLLSEDRSLSGFNFLLSEFYTRLGDYKKVEECLYELASTPENMGIIHLYMGLCYYCRGFFDRAIEEFKKSNAVEEFKGETYAFMALCYKDLGDLYKTREMIERARNFIRFLEPVLCYRLCILMGELNLKEDLDKFLDKTLWLINSFQYFPGTFDKETILADLTEIRKKYPGTKEEKLEIKSAPALPAPEFLRKDMEQIFNLMTVKSISIELGHDLLALVDPNQATKYGNKFMEHTGFIKKQVAMDLGVVIPDIYFTDNLNLEPDMYVIKIKDAEITTGELVLNSLLAVGPQDSLNLLKGIRYIDNTYGVSLWITQDQQEKAEDLGCIIFEPISVMATKIKEILHVYAYEFIDRQYVKEVLESVKKSRPALIKEIYPSLFTLGEIREVLVNLLREKISIRDIVTILETLGNYAKITKDTDRLTEYVRRNLSTYICSEYRDSNGIITVMTIEPDLEKIIIESVRKDDYSSYLFLDPSTEKNILTAFGEAIKDFVKKGIVPVVLCSPSMRLYVKRLTEKFYPSLAVLSRNEITGSITVGGTVKLPEKLALKIKNRDVSKYIEKLLSDSDGSVRMEAIKLTGSNLNRLNKDSVFTFLDRGLEDKDKRVRLESARVLNELYGRI